MIKSLEDVISHEIPPWGTYLIRGRTDDELQALSEMILVLAIELRELKEKRSIFRCPTCNAPLSIKREKEQVLFICPTEDCPDYKVAKEE